MPKLSLIKQDLAAESGGVWIPCDLLPGVWFKIARHNNPRFRKRWDELIDGIRGAYQAGEVPQGTMRPVLAKCIAETIVLDQRGVDDEETGEPAPYSVSAMTARLSDERFDDLLQWFDTRCKEAAHFRARAREQALGNSQGSSSGGSATEQATPSS